MNTLRAAYNLSKICTGFSIPKWLIFPEDHAITKTISRHVPADGYTYEVKWDHEPTTEEKAAVDAELAKQLAGDNHDDLQYLHNYFKAQGIPVISVIGEWPIKVDLGQTPKPEHAAAVAAFIKDYVPGSQKPTVDQIGFSSREQAALLVKLDCMATGKPVPSWVTAACDAAMQKVKDAKP